MTGARCPSYVCRRQPSFDARGPFAAKSTTPGPPLRDVPRTSALQVTQTCPRKSVHDVNNHQSWHKMMVECSYKSRISIKDQVPCGMKRHYPTRHITLEGRLERADIFTLGDEVDNQRLFHIVLGNVG